MSLKKKQKIRQHGKVYWFYQTKRPKQKRRKSIYESIDKRFKERQKLLQKIESKTFPIKKKLKEKESYY